MKLFSKKFLIILMISSLLRVFVSIYSFQYRENTDVLRYRDWGMTSFLYGFQDAYKPDHLTFGSYPSNMPPGSVYINSLMYFANIQLSKPILKITGAKEGSLQWVNGALLNFSLRIPSLISDLLTGTIIYLLLKKHSEKNALFASSLFLFNPVILYNSAFWGQMDSINNAIFLGGIFFLAYRKYLFAILSLFLSLYVKLTMVFIIPILAYVLIRNASLKKVILYTISSIFLILILTIPVSSTPHSWLLELFKKSSLGELREITAFAFNFWWIIFIPNIQSISQKNLFSFSDVRLFNSPDSSTVYFGLPLTIWAILLFLFFSLPVFYKLIKTKKIVAEQIFLALTLIALIGYLFLPRMHERYMYSVFPFFAAYLGFQRKFVWIFLLLSILNLLNLYIVWHPMKLFFMPYELINNKNFQWIIALSTVFLSLVFYLKSLRKGFSS